MLITDMSKKPKARLRELAIGSQDAGSRNQALVFSDMSEVAQSSQNRNCEPRFLEKNKLFY